MYLKDNKKSTKIRELIHNTEFGVGVEREGHWDLGAGIWVYWWWMWCWNYVHIETIINNIVNLRASINKKKFKRNRRVYVTTHTTEGSSFLSMNQKEIGPMSRLQRNGKRYQEFSSKPKLDPCWVSWGVFPKFLVSTSDPCQLFYKVTETGDLPNSFWGANIILIPKAEKHQ